jgi:hypothetical protein
MLVLQALIELIESRVLRYRPSTTDQRQARTTTPTAKG